MLKKILLSCGLLIAAAGISVGVIFANNFNETPLVVWGANTFKSSYDYGSTIFVPNINAKVAGDDVEVSPKILFPSKKMIKKNSAVLDEIGTYTIVYEINYQGKGYSQRYTFDVMSSLFSFGQLSSAYYGIPENAKEHEGLIFNLAQGEEILFNKPIDIHNFTSDDIIISGYIAPKKLGSYDFEKLLITFYDSENPDIWYRQHIRRRDMVSTTGINDVGCSYYYGGANGQGTAGANVKEADPQSINKNNEWGPMSRLPFDGVYNIVYLDEGEYKSSLFDNQPVDDYLFRLSMDMRGYEVYTTEWQRDRTGEYVAGQQKIVKHFITDLDNPNFYNDLFYGFPSGKIKIGISADMYSSDKAQFVITDIAGIDLTLETYVDDVGPKITVQKEYGDEIPLAEVGYSYEIPSAFAVDENTGEAPVEVSVWFNYGNEKQTQVSVKNNRFSTDKVGWYTILYEAYDKFYNYSSETISVFCGLSIPELEIKVEAEVKDLFLGECLVPAPYEVKNSSGYYKTEILLIDPDDNEYEASEDFIIEMQGEWIVEYTVVDMIGRIATTEYIVNASISSLPVVNKSPLLELPQTFIAGGVYSIPECNGVIYYDDFDYEDVDCSFFVKLAGEIEEVEEFYEVPSYLSDATFAECVYEFEGETIFKTNIPYVDGLRYDESSEEHPIKVNLQNYFIGDNFCFLRDNVGENAGIEARVVANDEKSSFIYANPVLANRFAISLTYEKNTNDYSGIEIKLTDSNNKNNSVTSYITLGEFESTMTVDGSSINIPLDKNSNSTFTVSYNSGIIYFGNDTRTSFLVNHNDLGKEFDSFDSDKVYVEVSLVNASIDSKINIIKINNQFMYKNEEDIDETVPEFIFIGTNGGTYSQESIFNSPIMIMQDVIAPNVDCKLDISGPNGLLGSELDPSESHEVFLSEIGAYRFVYRGLEYYANDDFTEDDANVVETTIVAYSIDDIAPEIVLDFEMVTTAKVNDTIELSGFTAIDNSSEESSIIKTRQIIGPNGLIYTIPDEITKLKVTISGLYIIRYVAIDENGNLAVLDHRILVE